MMIICIKFINYIMSKKYFSINLNINCPTLSPPPKNFNFILIPLLRYFIIKNINIDIYKKILKSHFNPSLTINSQKIILARGFMVRFKVYF